MEIWQQLRLYMQISLNLGSYTRKKHLSRQNSRTLLDLQSKPWTKSPIAWQSHKLQCYRWSVRQVSSQIKNASSLIHHKVNRYGFFTFYATTCAEKCNHQLVVATTGAFTLTSVIVYTCFVFVFCVLSRIAFISRLLLYFNCIFPTFIFVSLCSGVSSLQCHGLACHLWFWHFVVMLARSFLHQVSDNPYLGKIIKWE